MGTISLHFVTRPQSQRKGLPGWWLTYGLGRKPFFMRFLGGEKLHPCWTDANTESPARNALLEFSTPLPEAQDS